MIRCHSTDCQRCEHGHHVGQVPQRPFIVVTVIDAEPLPVALVPRKPSLLQRAIDRVARWLR